MAQTDFTAKQMGKQAVIFGAAALIATFLLSCLLGLLTAGGMLPESAMQVVSMGILCVCVFASSFLAAKAAPGKKLIAAVLSAVVYWLALAVFAFRDKFSEKERQSGVANLIMGACFITEGAIPFAAADPLRVLPACIIGSAVAGGLSMFFGCGLRAPHGGIFVLPVISHPFGFLAAVILGALVGMLLLGVLRKRIEPSES